MARAWAASASWKTSPDAKKGSAPGCPALLQPSPVSRDPNQSLSEEMPIVFHSVTMTQHFSKLASGMQVAPRRILREKKDQARSSPAWQGSPTLELWVRQRTVMYQTIKEPVRASGCFTRRQSASKRINEKSEGSQVRTSPFS